MKIKLRWLAFFFSFMLFSSVAFSSGEEGVPVQKVINGDSVSVDQQKSLGLVTIHNGQGCSPRELEAKRCNCSATLLNRYWVLTARHCVTVTVNSDTLQDPATMSVTATWVPGVSATPTYIHQLGAHLTNAPDMVLVLLENSDFGYVASQRIYRDYLKTSDTVTQYGQGYGTLASGVYRTPSERRASGRGVYRSAQYSPKWDNDLDEQPIVISANRFRVNPNERGQVPMSGDSGGPAFATVNGASVGIAGIATNAHYASYIAGIPYDYWRYPDYLNYFGLESWEFAEYAAHVSYATFASTAPFADEINTVTHFATAALTTHPSVTSVTSTSATFSVQSNVNATGYWIVRPTADPMPTVAEIRANAGSNWGSMSANTPFSRTLSGLFPNKKYTLYFVAEAAGVYSTPGMAHFTTAPPAGPETIEHPPFPLQTFSGFNSVTENILAPTSVIQDNYALRETSTWNSVFSSGNSVTLRSGTVAHVYGASDADARPVMDNQVFIRGGSAALVIGGYSRGSVLSDETVHLLRNSVTVSGGTVGDVKGGYAGNMIGTARALWNTVDIYSTVNGNVHGGEAMCSSRSLSRHAYAMNNSVNINHNSTVNRDVYGGEAMCASDTLNCYAHATNNSVDIAGTVNGSVYGGSTRNAGLGGEFVTGNTVTILSGGTVRGGIYGGRVTAGDLNNVGIDDNTLNLTGTTGTTVAELDYFQNLNFDLPSTQLPTDAVLTVTGTARLHNSVINVSFYTPGTTGSQPVFQPGDRITLIQAGTLAGNFSPRSGMIGNQPYTLVQEDNNLVLIIGVGNGTLVTGVTLDTTDTTLAVGDTETLRATVAPANATNSVLRWSSSDETVATVDQNGQITALGAGVATITATATDGSGASASCLVTVTSVGGGSGGGSPWTRTTYTPEEAATLQNRTVFFAHNVVGGDITSGLRSLEPGFSMETLWGWQRLSQINIRGFTEYSGLSNSGNHYDKIDDFERLMGIGGSDAQIAFFKFFFQDFHDSRPNDADEVFNTYVAKLGELEQRYPDVTFVHVTAPIYPDEVSWSNAVLHAFNENLRARYGSLVFDLAAIEAVDANGQPVFSTTSPAVGAPVLANDWKAGTGSAYLNEAGRQRVASGLISFLAQVPLKK